MFVCVVMRVSFRLVMSKRQFKSGLWEPEVLQFHKFSTARLPVEDKYAVKNIL